jgi:hypothetical protein
MRHLKLITVILFILTANVAFAQADSLPNSVDVFDMGKKEYKKFKKKRERMQDNEVDAVQHQQDLQSIANGNGNNSRRNGRRILWQVAISVGAGGTGQGGNSGNGSIDIVFGNMGGAGGNVPGGWPNGGLVTPQATGYGQVASVSGTKQMYIIEGNQVKLVTFQGVKDASGRLMGYVRSGSSSRQLITDLSRQKKAANSAQPYYHGVGPVGRTFELQPLVDQWGRPLVNQNGIQIAIPVAS